LPGPSGEGEGADISLLLQRLDSSISQSLEPQVNTVKAENINLFFGDFATHNMPCGIKQA